MFHLTRNSVRRFGAKIAAASLFLGAAVQSHAAGLDDLFDSVDLSGTGAKIAALAVLIVGIAFTLKGPSIVKRIIAKI